MSDSTPVRIALVAGEMSGDILGAGLIRSLKKRFPNAQFEGIGGPLMLAEGFNSLFSMERLSVMGLVEVLGRLRELMGIRKSLREHYLENPPDVFIGIDAPDFNLKLERRLRDGGIKTVHYVSPSVWAWRQGRIKGIAQSIDLMLTLFPFEADFYQGHNVPVSFVGHTLADDIPMEVDSAAAIEKLSLPHDKKIVALLPGSREGEVARLGALFLQTAQRLYQQRSDLFFVIPAANEARKLQLEQLVATIAPDLPVRLVMGQSHDVMASSDAILIASGTAALEAMLLKKPMVVSYKVAPLTYMLVKRMLKTPFVSLPNLLAGREMVPEILQNDATVENLSEAMLVKLENNEELHHLIESYSFIHKQLKRGASESAAQAIADLIHC